MFSLSISSIIIVSIKPSQESAKNLIVSLILTHPVTPFAYRHGTAFDQARFARHAKGGLRED
jgi:hypothetical protein